MDLKNTDRAKDSIISVIILLLLLFLFFKQKSWIYTALAVSIVSLLSTGVASYLHKLWTFISEILGRISGTIILALVFFIVLFPTAILKRLFGKKDILLSRKKLKSVFHDRNHKYSGADMENPW